MEQNDESQKPTGPSADAQSAAMPAGEIALRWKWVERSVWTDRMLMALERGVKGGRWYSLMDKVWSESNLLSAWLAVAANDGAAGVDRQSIGAFRAHRESELQRLSQELRSDRYQRQAARRVWIDKPGSREQRPLGIPCVRDRVVEGAIRQVLEPIFEREFAEHSYGFRPGRSAQMAVGRVEGLLQAGYTWTVDADLKSYLDPYSDYTLAAAGSSKSCGWLSKTRMRKPFCLPRLTWTTANSPRFTRCMIVCRDTPSRRMA
jgi:RNA-directed DNA polymerase